MEEFPACRSLNCRGATTPSTVFGLSFQDRAWSTPPIADLELADPDARCCGTGCFRRRREGRVVYGDPVTGGDRNITLPRCSGNHDFTSADRFNCAVQPGPDAVAA
jgi:hypothetical protein